MKSLKSCGLESPKQKSPNNPDSPHKNIVKPSQKYWSNLDLKNQIFGPVIQCV